MALKHRQFFYRTNVSHYKVQEKEFEGRTYLVVPVTMMVEGVHSGSHGSVYHSEEELANSIAFANGRPVVIYHPEQDGKYISANLPEIIEKQGVGTIYHTRYEEGLKAEAWLDKEKLERISPETYTIIMEGKPLEVSTGVFSDDEVVDGEWNGENYIAIAHNLRHDHLALLPGQVGACSWGDGCGVRANQEKKMDKVIDFTKPSIQELKELAKKGFSAFAVGYREVTSALQDNLNAMDNSSTMYILEDCFEDGTFIYSEVNFDSDMISSKRKMWRRKYTVDKKKGTVELGEVLGEVTRKTEYVNMTVHKEEKEEEKENKQGGVITVDKKAKIKAIIEKKFSGFSEKDQAWLESLDDARIDQFAVSAGVVEVKKEPEANKTTCSCGGHGNININSDQVVAVVKDHFKKNPNAIVEYLPGNYVKQLERGMKLYESKRKEFIEHIKANQEGNAFTEEVLNKMDDEALETLAKAFKPKSYYGGRLFGDETFVNANKETDNEEDVYVPMSAHLFKTDVTKQ